MMFKRRKAPMTADVETLIGPGTRVDGNLLVSAGVHLEGQVRGNVSAPDEGGAWLFVAERGVVEGQVDVPRVIQGGARAARKDRGQRPLRPDRDGGRRPDSGPADGHSTGCGAREPSHEHRGRG
jgi:hypothetical protein